MSDQRRINQILGEVTVGTLIDRFEEAVIGGEGYADARNALREAFAAARPSPFAAQSPIGSGEVAMLRQKFIAVMRELNGRYPEPETGMWPSASARSTPRLLNELEDAFDKLASLSSPVSPRQETEKPRIPRSAVMQTSEYNFHRSAQGGTREGDWCVDADGTPRIKVGHRYEALILIRADAVTIEPDNREEQ